MNTLLDKIFDHSTMEPLGPSPHYPDFLCFDQAFFLVKDRVREALRNTAEESAYPEEYIKIMALLLFIRGIYRGDLLFFHHEGVYGIPFDPPIILGATKIDFYLQYKEFTGMLQGINSLLFNTLMDSIPAKSNQSFENHQGNNEYGTLKFKYSAGGRASWHYVMDKPSFHLFEPLTETSRLTKSMPVPQEYADKFFTTNLSFLHFFSAEKCFVIEREERLLPCDKRFLIYEEIFEHPYFGLSQIYFQPANHFYLFLLSNGIDIGDYGLKQFKKANTGQQEITAYIREKIELSFDFWQQNTAYREDFFRDFLAQLTDDRIMNFLEIPYAEFERDAIMPIAAEGGVADISQQVRKKANQFLAENPLFRELDSGKLQQLSDFFRWHDFAGNLEGEEAKYREAMLLLLNPCKRLTQKEAYKRIWPDGPGKQTGSAWGQQKKRDINRFAKKYNLPELN